MLVPRPGPRPRMLAQVAWEGLVTWSDPVSGSRAGGAGRGGRNEDWSPPRSPYNANHCQGGANRGPSEESARRSPRPAFPATGGNRWDSHGTEWPWGPSGGWLVW